MEVLIIDQSHYENWTGYDLSCGNKNAFVSFSKNSGIVCVCVQNASHKVFKKGGRLFVSFQEASDAYKSPKVKAMIGFLKDATKPELAVAAE